MIDKTKKILKWILFATLICLLILLTATAHIHKSVTCIQNNYGKSTTFFGEMGILDFACFKAGLCQPTLNHGVLFRDSNNTVRYVPGSNMKFERKICFVS